jgi:hypothetical protein
MRLAPSLGVTGDRLSVDEDAMVSSPGFRLSRGVRRLRFCALLTGALALLAPANATAAGTTFGSPLSVPATLDTARNLGYRGTDTSVLPTPETPTGVVHTTHYGADTALWNVALANGQATSPATGQAVKVSLEGCAQPNPRGPMPLTQIHFQDLSPLPGGGARVSLTSQPFDIPVCGRDRASGSTVTTYEPINLCVVKGDYVALNEEGGFVEKAYQDGVPYQVLGSVAGSIANSFIRGDGTGNGTSLRSSDFSSMDGFASNRNEELMLRVTLGTGRDATHICAGGTAGAPRVLAPLRISPQTDGVNRSQVVAVAVYCRPVSGCSGMATLGPTGTAASYGRSTFRLRGDKTGHVPIHINSGLMRLVRRHHGMSALLTLTMGGRLFAQTITVKIL